MIMRCIFRKRSSQRLLAEQNQLASQREHHEYQLYLAIENIDHTKTKARSPQTNGICERFHRTMQDEFYSVAFRKRLYTNLEQLQTDAEMSTSDRRLCGMPTQGCEAPMRA